MSGTIEIRWRRLRLSLAACGAAALAGGGFAATAWWHENRVTEGMKAAETRLAEARGHHATLAGEREKWHRFGALYGRLAAHGRLGPERPERRTEAVRRAAAGVLAARHRFGAAHVVERTGPVEVRATDMSIELEMRHEAELPAFLAALEREAPGLFTVSGCRLVRKNAEEPPLAAIGASCRIRWQSVVLSGAEPGWTPAAGSHESADAGAEQEQGGPILAEPPRGGTFGRLFMTAAERAEIESALAVRPAVTEPADTPPVVAPTRSEPPPRPIRWVRVGGVVARSGRSVYAWMDGRRVVYDGSDSQEAPPAGAGGPGIRLDAGGRSIVVRPGERFDPLSGAVTGPLRRPQDRPGQGRFLRRSSPAPLTESRVPEQN